MGHRAAQQSFLGFLSLPRFFVHTLHTLHHRALRHGFLAHLHVLHHVLHHLLLHLCLSRIHGDLLLHHVGEDGGHQAHLLVSRRAVHFGELLGELSILRLHVLLHFLFLFFHFLAALHHFGLRHVCPLRRLLHLLAHVHRARLRLLHLSLLLVLRYCARGAREHLRANCNCH